jgi:hypothetical protein
MRCAPWRFDQSVVADGASDVEGRAGAPAYKVLMPGPEARRAKQGAIMKSKKWLCKFSRVVRDTCGTLHGGLSFVPDRFPGSLFSRVLNS